MAGNHLTISTAVYTDALYADKLLAIDLYLGFHGPDNILRAARIFMAINKCTEELRLLYSRLETLRYCPELCTPLVTVDKTCEGHAIYLAKMPFGVSSSPFGQVYCGVQRKCSSLARRPRPPARPSPILYQRVISDIHMVVMEYFLDVSPFLRFFEWSALPHSPNHEIVRETLQGHHATPRKGPRTLVLGDIYIRSRTLYRTQSVRQ